MVGSRQTYLQAAHLKVHRAPDREQALKYTTPGNTQVLENVLKKSVITCLESQVRIWNL